MHRDTLVDTSVFDLSSEELDILPYGVVTLDRAGTILRYNAAEAKFAQRTSAGTIGRGFFSEVAPCTNVRAFRGRFDAFARRDDSGVEQFDFTFAFRWGSQDVTITLLRKAGTDDINLVVRGRFHAALDIAPQARAAIPLASQVQSGRPEFEDSTAWTHEIERLGAWEIGSAEDALWRKKIVPVDATSASTIAGAALALRRPYDVEYRVAGPDRRQRIVQEHVSFGDAMDANAYATIFDVTEQRLRESNLWDMAHYDLLTGLPNRALLLKRINAAVDEVCDTGRVAAIASLVVERFEPLSKAYGRDTSDEFLRRLAARLATFVSDGDTVAHLDGASFVVLFSNVENVERVATMTDGLLVLLSKPFTIGSRTHQSAACLGISVTPRNGTDAEALLQAAETAMSISRRAARQGTVWYSNAMTTTVDLAVSIEHELSDAIARSELVLHYQPIVDIADNRIVAVEALVRWNHPVRGLLMPGDFIAVAERAGLITALGNWVLRDACRQARQWFDRGIDLHVCVNVSADEFRQANFANAVEQLVTEAGIPPAMLELELTESVMVDGFSDVIETIAKLKLAGIRLAIDDFGTGYSSLSYLKYFPINTLKIDRSFVSDIVNDAFDRAIAKTVITLANDLRLDCLAEGVETQEQLDVLRELGCHRFQGYFFSRPQPPEALRERLSSMSPVDRDSK